MNPAKLITWPARMFPDRIAVRFGQRELTFRECNQRINKLANGLLSLGIERGDHVGLLMSNSPELIEARFAIAKAGLTMIRLNARDAMETQRYILQHSETAAIFVGKEFGKEMKNIKKRLPRLKHYLALSPPDADFIDYESFLAAHSDREPEVNVNPETLDNIRYTSGTTGRPKGVMMTYKAMQCRLQNFFMNVNLLIRPDDICLNVAPLTHAAGNIFMPFYFKGATNIVLKGFDERLVLETIEREKVTAVLLVPTMINRLIDHPRIREFDTSSLRRIFYGTSPFSPTRLEKAISIFGPILQQNYGMAEAIMPLICLHPHEHIPEGDAGSGKRLHSVGRPALGVEVRVVDKRRREVSPGQIGEIIVRGDHMLKGYWKNKKETSKILKKGWLHTGDLATVDEEGFITIMDRKKDLIISGGFNIYPKEIENLIHTHLDVKEVAVVGVPDDTWGESVKAYVVPQEGHDIDAEGIIELCRNKLASYKKPKFIEVVNDLPKNAVGKILKKQLREKEWQGRERRVQ